MIVFTNIDSIDERAFLAHPEMLSSRMDLVDDDVPNDIAYLKSKPRKHDRSGAYRDNESDSESEVEEQSHLQILHAEPFEMHTDYFRSLDESDAPAQAKRR